MSALCIISCAEQKIWDEKPEVEEVAAKDAYTSDLFKKCKAYAKRFYEDWVILSSKYGFLEPTDNIAGNYSLTFSSPSSEVVSISTLKEQMKEKELDSYDKIVFLGGHKYQKKVEQVFGGEYDYHCPLEGSKGIGDMLGKLGYALQNNEQLE